MINSERGEVFMSEMKMGDVIRQEKIIYKDSMGREETEIVLVANAKCPKWYFKLLQETGIKIKQE
jgi:hypothetical protein